MTSTTSVQFLAVPPVRVARPRRWAVSAATTSNIPAAAAAEVADGRLEARVEEREGGYWVLKEKYRAGINPSEKVKLEKDPMVIALEGGVQELAGKTMEEMDRSKAGKDDVDVRLKWLGLFHRRKHQWAWNYDKTNCVVHLELKV